MSTTPDAAAQATASASEFDALLGELDVIAKAMPAVAAKTDDDKDDKDDKAAAGKVAAAAADGANADAATTEDKDDQQNGDFAKSFKVTLENGTEVEAFDGTEMTKALRTDIEERKRETGLLLKAMGQASIMLKAQGELIKSLQGEVKRLGASGSGRRTVMTVREPAEQAAAAGQPYPTVMAKALSLQKEGKMTGMDVCRVEAHVNRFGEIPADLAALLA